MKLGSFNGTVEEAKDLFENSGLNLEDYFEPQSRIEIKFLIIPGVLLGAALLLLALFANQCSPTTLTLVYLLGFSGATWLTASTQLRFKNTLATFAVAIGALLMVLVASGIFSPREAAEFVKELNK